VKAVALLLGLYEDHGVVPEGAADEGGQQRLSVRLLPRPQPHEFLTQVPSHYLRSK